MAQIIGIGTDIVECLRIAQMIERHGELFITRVYTEHEIEYCKSRKQGTRHFAGRRRHRRPRAARPATTWSNRRSARSSSQFPTAAPMPRHMQSRCQRERTK